MTNIFAPFEPEGDEPRRRRFKPVPVRILLPNVITLLSLCLGLTGIRMALEDRLELAIGCIVLAAVLDGLDGRVARLLQSTSRFGAELDSLADFVCFGVVPGIILYQWGLAEFKNVGWIAALVFAMCAALRLARFNVMLEDPASPEFAGNFFVGVPAPAAALVVADEAWANEHGLTPMARIVATAQHAQKPVEFTTAPIGAIEKVLDKAGLSLDDIDLFEINEAFAVVSLAAQDALGIPTEKLNVNGGSVAIGHPIGASGARILTTLLHAMEQRGARRGLAAICIGGGEATAILVERDA